MKRSVEICSSTSPVAMVCSPPSTCCSKTKSKWFVGENEPSRIIFLATSRRRTLRMFEFAFRNVPLCDIAREIKQRVSVCGRGKKRQNNSSATSPLQRTLRITGSFHIIPQRPLRETLLWETAEQWFSGREPKQNNFLLSNVSRRGRCVYLELSHAFRNVSLGHYCGK